MKCHLLPLGVSLCVSAGFFVASCAQPDKRQVDSGAAPAATATHDDDDGDEEEVEVPLDQVPANVLEAARAAVPGIVLEEAEVEQEDGATVYCVEGEVEGAEYEVEVRADGTVLEIEQEGDDDGDDDSAGELQGLGYVGDDE